MVSEEGKKRINLLAQKAQETGDVAAAEYYSSLLKEDVKEAEVAVAVQKPMNGYRTVPLWQAEQLFKDELPRAELKDIYFMPDKSFSADCKIAHKKVVVINGLPFETVSTSKYKLVQFEDARKRFGRLPRDALRARAGGKRLKMKREGASRPPPTLLFKNGEDYG